MNDKECNDIKDCQSRDKELLKIMEGQVASATKMNKFDEELASLVSIVKGQSKKIEHLEQGQEGKAALENAILKSKLKDLQERVEKFVEKIEDNEKCIANLKDNHTIQIDTFALEIDKLKNQIVIFKRDKDEQNGAIIEAKNDCRILSGEVKNLGKKYENEISSFKQILNQMELKISELAKDMNDKSESLTKQFSSSILDPRKVIDSLKTNFIPFNQNYEVDFSSLNEVKRDLKDVTDEQNEKFAKELSKIILRLKMNADDIDGEIKNSREKQTAQSVSFQHIFEDFDIKISNLRKYILEQKDISSKEVRRHVMATMKHVGELEAECTSSKNTLKDMSKNLGKMKKNIDDNKESICRDLSAIMRKTKESIALLEKETIGINHAVNEMEASIINLKKETFEDTDRITNQILMLKTDTKKEVSDLNKELQTLNEDYRTDRTKWKQLQKRFDSKVSELEKDLKGQHEKFSTDISILVSRANKELETLRQEWDNKFKDFGNQKDQQIQKLNDGLLWRIIENRANINFLEKEIISSRLFSSNPREILTELRKQTEDQN